MPEPDTTRKYRKDTGTVTVPSWLVPSICAGALASAGWAIQGVIQLSTRTSLLEQSQVKNEQALDKLENTLDAYRDTGTSILNELRALRTAGGAQP